MTRFDHWKTTDTTPPERELDPAELADEDERGADLPHDDGACLTSDCPAAGLLDEIADIKHVLETPR